jgi:hypothetical protein
LSGRTFDYTGDGGKGKTSADATRELNIVINIRSASGRN